MAVGEVQEHLEWKRTTVTGHGSKGPEVEMSSRSFGVVVKRLLEIRTGTADVVNV